MGSVIKREATLIEVCKKDYAQYRNVAHITYKPKGKRTNYVTRSAYSPYILVLEGWDHPEPDSFLGPAKTQGDVVIRESRYLSFDDRYKTDFDNIIDDYIPGKNVIVDIRHTKNTDLIKLSA